MENDLITIAEIDRLAELSALRFSDEDKERLKGEVGGVVTMLDQCGEIQTNLKGVARSMSLAELRDDEFVAGLSSENIFENAPSHDGEYFVVPEVNNGL